MEIATGPLTPEQTREEVVRIAGIFGDRGIQKAVVSYGFGCNLPIDELWKDISINVDDLISFVDQSIKDGHYAIGYDDFYISDSEKLLNFRLDHESDVHLSSDDLLAIDQIQAQWLAQGIPCYRRTHKEEKWMRIDPPRPAMPLRRSIQ